jgi:glycosyltransferase involved in cell wall biosynthesis
LDREQLQSANPKTRVIHVINGLATGGAETVLYRLATYPSNVEHEIVCLERRAAFSDRLEAAGIPVHHLNWTSPTTSLRDFVRLYRLIKQSGADVVQAWMYRSNLLAGLAGKLAGIPVVWNIRGSTLEPLRLATRVLARTGGIFARWLPEATINCSARSAELHSSFGYKAADEVIIGNGYNPHQFEPDEGKRNFIRRELGVEADAFLVGAIARWHPQKGHPVLLHALELLNGRGIRAPLVLVGRGLDSGNVELQRLIRVHKLSSCTYLLGERADISDIARALDLHVLASIGGEGFPNAVAETMLSGTPNVVTDVGESSLIVEDTGWIASPGDPTALANAIEWAHAEWSKSPANWQQRRRRARKRVADNFGIDQMVKAYERVWRQVALKTNPLSLNEEQMARGH